MRGLSIKAVEAIERLVGQKFDDIGMQFLGIIPKITKEKRIVFSTTKNSLTSLFLQALGTREPNKEEENTLKVILRIANGYVEALKERTQSRIIQDINAYMLDQNSKREPIKINKIKSVFRDEMNKAGKHFKLIANTESNKTTNLGTALQISKVGKSNGEEDPVVFFIVTVDDVTGPEEFVLHLLPDKKTPRLWKLSEIGNEYHKKGDTNPKMSGLHPNCFVGNSGVNVLTEKEGYKNIKDVNIGDRVLTHTGKFKQVLNTLKWYNKKYYGSFVKIKYKTFTRDGEKTTTLRVTPEHEFMTQRGWVKAEELKNTDKFRHLHTNCATCNKKTEVRPKRDFKKGLEGYFCSKSCKAKYQWKSEKHRTTVSTKNSNYMKKKWQNPTNDMYEKVRKMNKINREMIQNKQFWAQKPDNLEILQKNIAKVNQKLQSQKTSKEEKALYKKVKDIFPTAQAQFVLEKWCVDIFIPELNVNIEYDGGGHYLPVYVGKYTMETFLSKQEGRDIYLEKCGYHVLRYSEIPSKDKIKEDVVRVSKNHNSEYFFEDIELLSVEFVKNGKGSYTLYDITVEDDESFVVNGIISHNCRCKLTYLAQGFGFDNNGLVTWKGADHNEFESQRKEYGLPRTSPMEKSEGEEEHPNNALEPDPKKHMVSHIANNGKKVWKNKQMTWGGKSVTPQDMDNLHRAAWKGYAQNNKVIKNTPFSNTMMNLNKMIVNDNDRHLKVAKTSSNPDPKHQEMRQRHLIYALGGQEGYSIENIQHPQTGQHMGVRIKAPRHHNDGNLGETSWFYDGNALKTEYDKITGKKWK